MEDLLKYRALRRLVVMQKQAAEARLGQIMSRRRKHLETARQSDEAARNAYAQESPAPGDFALATKSVAAMRRRAEEARRAAGDLDEAVTTAQDALAEAIRKLTALDGIIDKLSDEAARAEEEREDEATLSVTQMQRE